MSSTRDPLARTGHRAATADFYETPDWCVHRLLELTLLLNKGNRWLEPSAGRGAIINAVKSANRQLGRDYYEPDWCAIELRPECSPDLSLSVQGCGRAYTHDFLAWPKNIEPFDLCIGNPPFSLAREFIEHAVAISKVTAFLLRLNYFGTEKRHAFFRNWMPDLYVLPNRPSFSDDGQTDSIEYAWFVWDREHLDRRTGSITLLNTTPAEVRRRP